MGVSSLIESLRSRDADRRGQIAYAYGAHWAPALEDYAQLIKLATTLDEALTVVCDERDEAYDEIEVLKARLAKEGKPSAE
jgi:hypothetical protein